VWAGADSLEDASDMDHATIADMVQRKTWFVKAGMTPDEALKTTTVNAAELLAQEKSLGALHSGYLADVVAVEGDPLADIQVAIDGVRWVMKGGEVVFDKTK
jgi:imidazolonepropionase-like amidohydrolase